VYTAQDLDALLERHPLRLVQVPLNAFDQRLARSGHLANLEAEGIEVHVRSVFLQGLLLMEPERLGGPHFDRARGALAAFQTAARAAGQSPLQAAVSYVMSVPEVDVAVVGVTHETQFAEVLSAATPTLPQDWYAPFALEDEQILNPSLWPR
jgi:aryl-alcohol dehydrogenase-like predicted oxidoreductase